MDTLPIDRLADLFKTLADPARLRILGAVAERPLTGRELSERLRLTPPTISHHMAKLVAAGLVRVTPDAQRRSYSLDEAALHRLSREVAQPVSGTDQATPSQTDPDRERAKVLRDFFDGPRLKQLPAQRKKRVVVLQHLLTRFAPGREYPEKEVNALLREAHEDVTTLRRELIDYGYMNRQNGVYRVAAALPPRGPTVAQEITGDEQAWLQSLIAGATARALRPSDAAPEPSG